MARSRYQEQAAEDGEGRLMELLIVFCMTLIAFGLADIE